MLLNFLVPISVCKNEIFYLNQKNHQSNVIPKNIKVHILSDSSKIDSAPILMMNQSSNVNLLRSKRLFDAEEL